MNKEQMLLEIKNGICRELGHEITVEDSTFTKNNNTDLTCIKIDSGNTSIMIYYKGDLLSYTPDYFIQGYLHYHLSRDIEHLVNGLTDDDIKKLPIQKQLVNYKMNKAFFNNTDNPTECLVHKKVFDLAIIYKIVGNVGTTNFSVAVTRDILNRLGFTEEELEKVAVKPENPKIQSVNKILEDYTGMSILANDGRLDSDIYTVRNDNNDRCAIFMFDTDVLEQLADILGDRFYIVPDSIYTFLAVKVIDGFLEEAVKILRELNAMPIRKEDVLSYSIYEYNRETKEVTVAYAG